MTVTVKKGTAKGSVTAPPSKSMAHRYIICSALARGGISVIKNVQLSEDIKATLKGIKSLGAEYEIKQDTVVIKGGTASGKPVIDCNESGSTLRFLIPIAASLCGGAKFTGSERLFVRPLKVYEEIFVLQGIKFEKGRGFFTVDGHFNKNDFCVDGRVSSQFISGLLFALPLMGGGSIKITGGLESAPYIDMTLKALNDFGVNAKKTECGYKVPASSYSAADIEVEGDYSNAAFFDAFNYIGSDVTVDGLREDSLQGDKVYKEYFKRLQLEYCTLDIKDCPDLGPVLFAVAAANHGGRFCGTKRLKIKESDRANAMKTELRKFGINVTVKEDEVEISGTLNTPKQILCSHNDHRIVMALSLLCTITGGSISGAEAVNKSFPDYFKVLMTVGIDYEFE